MRVPLSQQGTSEPRWLDAVVTAEVVGGVVVVERLRVLMGTLSAAERFGVYQAVLDAKAAGQ